MLAAGDKLTYSYCQIPLLEEFIMSDERQCFMHTVPSRAFFILSSLALRRASLLASYESSSNAMSGVLAVTSGEVTVTSAVTSGVSSLTSGDLAVTSGVVSGVFVRCSSSPLVSGLEASSDGCLYLASRSLRLRSLLAS